MIPGIVAAQRRAVSGGGPASFPAIRNAQALASTGSAADLTVNYTASAGDLVIVHFSMRASAANAPTLDDTGWSLLVSGANGSNVASYVWTKVVSAGGSLTITPPSSLNCAALAVVIESGTHQGVVENATSSGSGAPNPASLSPSWGSAKTLWLATYCQAYGSTVSSYPLPNNQLHARSGTGSTNISMASCADEQETGTLDPAAYSVSTTAAYLGRHLAVRPA